MLRDLTIQYFVDADYDIIDHKKKSNLKYRRGSLNKGLNLST